MPPDMNAILLSHIEEEHHRRLAQHQDYLEEYEALLEAVDPDAAESAIDLGEPDPLPIPDPAPELVEALDLPKTPDDYAYGVAPVIDVLEATPGKITISWYLPGLAGCTGTLFWRPDGDPVAFQTGRETTLKYGSEASPHVQSFDPKGASLVRLQASSTLGEQEPDRQYLSKQVEIPIPEEPVAVPVTVSPSAHSVAIALSEMSFDEISAAGLDIARYTHPHQYVAEYLYLHPHVRYWNLDIPGRRITARTVPLPSSDTVQLPGPTGGDDTSMILEAIASAPGGRVRGVKGREYQSKGLPLKTRCSLWDVAIKARSDCGSTIFDIQADGVALYGCPVNAAKRGQLCYGYRIGNVHATQIIDGGFKNLYHTKHINSAGVLIRGARDYHIAGCLFKDLINDTVKTKTGRANAIWKNGGKTYAAGGGWIVNNTAINFQSNGMLNDAEFYTSQSHKGSAVGYDEIHGNRCLNAGKRLVKAQSDCIRACSNEYIWDASDGPLGRRTNHAVFNSQLDGDHLEFFHNRVTIDARGYWDNFLSIKQRDRLHTDIHCDRNDVTIKCAGDMYPHNHLCFVRNVGSMEKIPTNSSFEDNRFRGLNKAMVNRMFRFERVGSKQGKGFAHMGNETQGLSFDRRYH